MSEIVVFCGPSISAEAGRSILFDASFRGPAACGDVLRATLAGARVICLIDGYFDHRLSVWHKEILWALSRGIAVYGASSMGALRAAELAAYGMIGVGAIFEGYSSGALEDDDEVAVTHQPADRDYRTTSEAMVNLRATLHAAVARRVLSEGSASALLAQLKRRFYPERDRRALEAAGTALLTASEAERLSHYLAESGVTNQKLADAEAVLHRISADRQAGNFARSARCEFEFPQTNAWQVLFEHVYHTREARPAAEAHPAAPASPQPALQARLAKLQQESPDQYANVWQHAHERALAVAIAVQRGMSVDASLIQEEANRLRRQHGLLTPAQTAEWLSENDLDVSGFSRFINDNILTHQLADTVQEAVRGQLSNALRTLGEYRRE
jgi:hypothetical protein